MGDVYSRHSGCGYDNYVCNILQYPPPPRSVIFKSFLKRHAYNLLNSLRVLRVCCASGLLYGVRSTDNSVRAVQVLKDLESDYRVRAEQNLKHPHSIGLMACTGNTHRRTRILLSVALSRYDTGVGVSGGTVVIA
jgi:hypothetical protein